MKHYHRCRLCGKVCPEHSTYKLEGYHFCSEAHLNDSVQFPVAEPRSVSLVHIVVGVLLISVALSGFYGYQQVQSAPESSIKSEQSLQSPE